MKKKRERSCFYRRKSALFFLKMRLLIIFLTLGIVQSNASVHSQQNKLNVKFKGASLIDIFNEIEEISDFTFLYSNEDVDNLKGINISIKNATIEEILNYCFEGTSLTYTVNDKLVIIRKSPNKRPNQDKVSSEQNEQQKHEIKGKVTDINGIPLPGVNVIEKGTTNGAITDLNGEYSISVISPDAILSFSFIGYLTEDIEVEGKTIVDVTLVEDILSLDEVVVTALGIKKEKKAIGYSSQELGEEALAAARDVSLTGFLTGKVAGVQVSRTAGGATGSSSVTIRGNSSLLGSSQPLYVVDGVPIINAPKSSGGLWDGETDYGDGISAINPEDVLSVNVLKGPNASSLYGSRGANGVILITTKSGSNRKGIGVEVNSNVSFETINLFPNHQNKYGPGWEDQNINGVLVEIDGVEYETMPVSNNYSWGPPLDGTRTIVDPYVLPGTEPRTLTLYPQPNDNVLKFYETGVTNQNSIALTGGNEKTTARVSVGNMYYKGIIPNHRVDRQTVSARVTSQMTKFLSFDGKINYVHDEGSMRPVLGYSVRNPNYVFAHMGRTVPMDFLKEYYEVTGEPGQFPGLWGINPYYSVNELKNFDYRDRMIGYLSSTLQFTDWLSLMGRVGLDYYTEYREKDFPIGSTDWTFPDGGIITDLLHYKELNADVILSANKQLNDNFSISANAGANLLRQHRDRILLTGSELSAEDVYHIGNANIVSPYQSLYEKELQSVFFTGQIGYRDFLYLDVTGRNDWSSALGLNNQSYFYPSVSTSFIFTEALNMASNVLSFGKARVSWAQVGNDSDPYLTVFGYNLHTDGYNGQGFVSTPGTVPLVNLKNELTESWEIGVDLRFFNNRLSVDGTYYNSFTTNQIIPANISSTSGYESVIINAGRIDNRGIEAIIGISPFRNAKGFSWDINFNFSKNKNKVIELTEDIDTYALNGGYIGNNISINATVGRPYGDIMGLDTKKAPDGQYVVAPNGRYANADSITILGNIQPDWIGGLNNTFSYKGFSLSMLFDFVQGGNIFSLTKHEMTSRGVGKWTEVGREGAALPGVKEVFDEEGNVIGYEENDIIVNGQNYWLRRARGQGNWFILDASYITLREVLLSYRLQEAFLEKTPFSDVTLSLVGRNLFYLEEHMEDLGIAPESAPNTSATYAGYETFTTPSTRTFGLNVKLIF